MIVVTIGHVVYLCLSGIFITIQELHDMDVSQVVDHDIAMFSSICGSGQSEVVLIWKVGTHFVDDLPNKFRILDFIAIFLYPKQQN